MYTPDIFRNHNSTEFSALQSHAYMSTLDFGRLRRFCCCPDRSYSCVDNAEPPERELLKQQVDEPTTQQGPPMLRRRGSVWQRANQKFERATARLGTLLRLEKMAGGMLEGEDPLPHCLLQYTHRIELLPLLPSTLRQKRWQLLFTTAEHGCSIRSVLTRCSGLGPTVFIVRDMQGHVFGAFASEAWRDHPQTHFHGTGETFLFSTWPEAKGFRAWGWDHDSVASNRSFQCSALDFIAFGSGGHFGLWLDNSLATGSTSRCDTFGNAPLTEHSIRGGLREPHDGISAFEVSEIQVWGFSSTPTTLPTIGFKALEKERSWVDTRRGGSEDM